MRYLEVNEVLALHKRIIERSGGSTGLRDLGALESCVAQPRATFGGQELYQSIVDKASALGFSLVMNHPFVDGNKRIGHAGMEVFLAMNGFEIQASVDQQEQIILELAAGKLEHEQFTDWLGQHMVAFHLRA